MHTQQIKMNGLLTTHYERPLYKYTKEGFIMLMLFIPFNIFQTFRDVFWAEPELSGG